MALRDVCGGNGRLLGELCVLGRGAAGALAEREDAARAGLAVGVVVAQQQGAVALGDDEGGDVHWGAG